VEYRFHRGALRNARCGADDIFVFAHDHCDGSVVGDCGCDECSVDIASSGEMGSAHWIGDARHLFGRGLYRRRLGFALWFVGVDRRVASGRHIGRGFVVAQ